MERQDQGLETKAESGEKDRVNRRSVLGALAATGVGASTSVWLTGEVGAVSSDQVTIVQGTKLIEQSDGTREVIDIKKEVPADWYYDLQQAKTAFERRNRHLLRTPGVIETTLSAGRYGGRNARIEVKLSPEAADQDGTTLDEVRGDIPTRIDGIEVKVQTIDRLPKLTNCYEHPSNPPEAGVQVETSDGWGSLGGRAYKNGHWHFMTAEHLWGSNPDVLYIDGDIIGDSEDWDCWDDFAALNPLNGWDPTDGIAGTSIYVTAQMSEDGIWDVEAAGETLSKQGARTCYTEGTCKGIGSALVYDSNCNNRDKQVKWGTYNDIEQGDSGALVYKPNWNGHDWAVSLVAAESDIVFGTGCFHIDNLHGYHWD